MKNPMTTGELGAVSQTNMVYRTGDAYLDAAKQYPHLPPAQAMALIACINLGIAPPESPETMHGLAKDSDYMEAKRRAWNADRSEI